MKINLFVNSNLNQLNFIIFFKQLKKFIFNPQSIRDIKLFSDQKNLIILNNDLLKNNLKKDIKKCLFLFPDNYFIFLSKSFSDMNLFNSYNIIKYPITIQDFETILFSKTQTKKIIFRNFELKFDNTLYNTKNNKNVHLTEIESKIIKLFFKNHTLNKKKLNSDVLNYSPNINSKSLDSHIYRLRKKLFDLDNKTKIVSEDNQNLKII